MLSGFECDEDQTGWLAGIAVWSVGATAACLVATVTIEPALPHWQVLVLAVAVSLISLGLRLPVMLTRCLDRTWLVHAVWMFAFFAQINWAGFLAARSSSGTIATEAILICLGMETWLLVMFAARGQLPWLQQLISGNANESIGKAEEPKSYRENEDAAEPYVVSTMHAAVATQYEDQDEERSDIRREFVDGTDENGRRYLSGSVRIEFESQQRTESFVVSFCPALDGIADVELECDSEDVTAIVEHATETGVRILVRRMNLGESSAVTVDWFATASATAQHSTNLP